MTLDLVEQARERLRARGGPPSEVVVDNASTDETAATAKRLGVRVLSEPARPIPRARNAGAREARGEVLVFVDADLAIEDALLVRVWELMRDPRCLGRAVQVRYEPARRAVRAYLAAWGLAARLAGIGGVQFCRRAAFEAPKGYDESLYMGEDADFFRRLRRLGGREGRRVVVVRDRGGWYEEALR